MTFVYFFLALAATFLLVQPEDLTNLKYFEEANITFSKLDSNKNGYWELSETIKSFEHFKKGETITKDSFTKILVGKWTSKEVAEALFQEYDYNNDGEINDDEFIHFKLAFDINKDRKVDRNEFIITFNEFLNNATAEVLPKEYYENLRA